MVEITTDSTNNMDILYEIIEENNLSGVEVLNLFTDWFGTQICTKEFLENITESEGYTL